MKRVYRAFEYVGLGKVSDKLRNTLEYGGGWTDTYLHPAKSGVDTWNVITKGSSRYRVDPGSQPQPRIPFSRKSQYQITYYNRDVRRNPTGNFAIEDSFGEEGKKLLFAPALAGVDPGSRGQKNPDVLRYDQTGLRTAMTASWGAMNKSLQDSRPNHLPVPAPQRSARAAQRAAHVQAALEAQGLVRPSLTKSTPRTSWTYTTQDMW